MTYTRRVDRNSPGCLIFMIDQSASMSERISGGDLSKASAVAEQLNGILYELIQRCSKSHGEPPRPYFGVAVLGYCTDGSGNPIVGSRLTGQLLGKELVWTTDLALNPLRLEQRERTNAAGQRATFRFPVWIDAFADGGTPMCNAFDAVGRIARSWVDQYPDGFPPIVLNLSDGESTDGDPAEWARRLTSLRTSDGNVLLFNIGISTAALPPTMFPNSSAGINDPYGRALFEISSPLPEFMLTAAKQQGFQVEQGARGFGLNADLRSLMTFLNIGTSVGHLLR